MIIYQGPADKQFRASSFDNDGHIIDSDVEVIPGTRIVFTLVNPQAPRYRLGYDAGTGRPFESI
jgi:hypothetical protein